MESSERPFDRFVSATKDSLGIVRELVLIAVLLLLLLAPAAVSKRLTDAGFVKANIAGFEWQQQVEQSVQQTGEARQQIEYIGQKIDSVRAELLTLAADVDGAATQQMHRLAAELDSLVGITNVARRDLRQSFQTQQSLLRQVNASMRAQEAPGAWGVVVSGDRSMEHAEHELRRARALGYTDALLYDRSDWLRTVVPFPTKAEAEAALPLIRNRLNDTAYPVLLDDWCPEAASGPQEHVVRCAGDE